VYKLKFSSATTQQEVPKSLIANSKASKSVTLDTYYTQFGDYITSITPYQYSAKFNFLFYQSQKYVVNLVGNNWENTNMVPYLDVDFSNNQEVTVLPALMISDSDNQFNWIGCQDYEDSNVTFTYFSFIAYYFYQEIELPVEYSNIEFDQLNRVRDDNYFNPEKIGNILKTKSPPLFLPFSENTDLRFNFGVFNPDATPFILDDTSTVIHGSFSPVTLSMPLEGETKVLYSTISFDSENLIQLYAGTDNIPYTKDDIIVYSPKYWERIKVKMEIK
jgi:hypothetical protein